MAAPTTLVDYWTAEIARLQAEITATSVALADAAKAEAAAADALAKAARDLTDERAQVDATRKALAAVQTPADGGPLLAQLQTALIALREAEAEAATAESGPARARVASAARSARAAALKTALAAVSAERDAEAKAAARRAAWKTAAVAAPLAGLPQAATNALTASKAQAATKVEGNFPTDANPDRSFLVRLRARRDAGGQPRAHADALAAHALANETTWLEATTRAAAKIPALRRAFDAAVATLGDFVAAPARVAAAADALAALAKMTAPVLTPSQHAELFSADPAVTKAREDALELLKKRDDAANALADARLAYANALADARITDPDSTEAALIATLPGLKTAHDAIAAREQDLTKANTDLATGGLPALKEWFAAVPDALWDQIDTLDASAALLQAITAINPANLVADVTAKEQALAKELDTASKEARIAARAASHVTVTAGLAAAEAGSELHRRAAAIRFVANI